MFRTLTKARQFRREADKLTELERICALAAASPCVRFYRDGGRTFEEIAQLKCCNPLGLSRRQLSRIYEGEDALRFDSLRRAVRDLDKPCPADKSSSV